MQFLKIELKPIWKCLKDDQKSHSMMKPDLSISGAYLTYALYNNPQMLKYENCNHIPPNTIVLFCSAALHCAVFDKVLHILAPLWQVISFCVFKICLYNTSIICAAHVATKSTTLASLFGR